MVLGRFREKYEKITLPIGRALGGLGLSPNMITVLSVIVSIISCWYLALDLLLIGGIFILLTGVVDMFDGAVARAMGKATKFGAVFDHVLDRYAEFFFILGLMLGSFTDWRIGVFCIFSMIMASFTRAKAESVGGLKSCTVGIAERQEKMGVLLAGILLSYLFPSLSFLGFSLLELCLLIIGVLSQVTVFQRLQYTKKYQPEANK